MTKSLNSTFFAVSVMDGVAHIEMDNAAKANSMTPAFWEDLPRIAADLDSDPGVRCVVLSGRGKHFTAGMDLAAFQGIMELTGKEPGRAAYAMRKLVLSLQASLSALEEMRVPVIAAIHGACLGGGIDLITACDIRLCTADTSFGIEEINIGMAADVGTLQRMPKLMAPGVVRELAYTGRRFSADEAKGWGIVNAIHADRDAVIAAALDMAQTIAARSPLAIAGIKQSVTFVRDHSVADGLDQIATWNAGMLRPDDLTRAMGAKMKQQQALFDDLLKDAG
ncbi:crotonase/enoyl-CoA hydratase family protein [Pseudosulfitobacter koreensis]|uniref:Crotonase/enoyl-CoA hydratase family protein n=1 Tax=Pseudosulfitobacter koreensis TaxID=2968472 RepID=A0ABT1YY98_9RHOB|nr:crotonase/enoyl-CoA hydratase family protein [Pseudosulfitobacter koreense]MCR8825816.1 crotonase/enoyl-CoA hydratase family protein [Pseudosulfitobacter koreense]